LRRLKRVILENFQSHRQTEIVLAPTVSALIGESDQGKSAVVRALRWLFYNKPQGADFVRVGADSCRVAAEFDDGVTVIREKRGRVNRYEIRHPSREPEVLEGVGREVPDRVREVVEIYPLRLEGASFELHVAHQLDPPFLLKETPAVRARAVGHLSGTDLFDAADKRAARRLSDLSRLRRELEEKTASLEAEMAGFGNLEDLEARLTRSTELFRLGEDAGVRAARLAGLKGKLAQVKRELAGIEDLLRALPQAEKLERVYGAVAGLALHRERIKVLKERRERVQEGLNRAREALGATARVPEAEAAVVVVESYQGLALCYRRRAGLLREKERVGLVLAALAALPEAEEAARHLTGLSAGLGRLRERHGRWMETRNRVARTEAVLARLTGIPAAERLLAAGAENINRTKRLGEICGRYGRLQREILRLAAQGRDAQAEIGRRGRELRELLLKASRCPLCLTPLSGPQVEAIVERMKDEG
jgi:exonuclease SbcC